MGRVALVAVAALAIFAACGEDPDLDTAAPATDTAPLIITATTERSPQTSVPLPTLSDPSAVTSPGEVDADAIDGPVMRYPRPSDHGDEMDALVLGVLELEGTCLYVSQDEVGERYPILWPAETRWDDEKRAVISPVGEAMAIGEEVSGGGGYLYVADVEDIAGPQASALAAKCVDNTYGEIAVVNNLDTAIGPGGP